MYIIRYLAALLLLSHALAASADLVLKDPVLTRDITVVQRHWVKLQAPAGKFKVTAWVDHTNNRYSVGETMILNVKTNEDAYLYIVDVGTSGKTHVIFPNQYQKNNRVRAGQTVQVPAAKAPFQFRVGGPVGTELIKVIATKQPRHLFKPEDFVQAGPFLAYKHSPQQLTRDITVILKPQFTPALQPMQVKPAPAGKPKPDWAEYSKVIRILQ